MGILHGQSRCRASDRGAESKINGRKMRSKSRSRELSLKGHFWTPYVRPVRETFASYGSREKDIMGKVHFANSTERSPWSACAFAGYLCTVSRPSPSGPSPCT